jgi:nicotinamide-nucleotide adenylyltransferase
MGHLKLVRDVAGDNELIIGIGSAQQSHTQENPFTAGERMEMINRVFAGEKIKNYFLVPIPDIHRYTLWPSHVASFCPKFEKVISNNPVTLSLFYDAGYAVESCNLYRRKEYSGREIRRRMIDDEDWRSLVPEEVFKFIEEIKGVERLKKVSKRDW